MDSFTVPKCANSVKEEIIFAETTLSIDEEIDKNEIEIDQNSLFSKFLSSQMTAPSLPTSTKRTSTLKLPFYCKFCLKDLKSRQTFLDHFSSSHPAITNKMEMFTDPWRCIFCNDVFASSTRLSLHIKGNHKNKLSLKDQLLSDGKPTQLHECKICGATMKTAQYLVKHTLKLHGYELTKNGCNDAVKDPRVCGICGQLCSGEQGLRCHLYWTHGKEVGKVDEAFKEFVDSELMASAEKADVVQKSVKRIKKNDEKIERPIRAKRSKPLAKPVANILESNKLEIDSNLFCSECQLTFENLRMIEKHRDLRHIKIQCSICSEWCTGRNVLDAHDDRVHFGALKVQSSRPYILQNLLYRAKMDFK